MNLVACQGIASSAHQRVQQNSDFRNRWEWTDFEPQIIQLGKKPTKETMFTKLPRIKKTNTGYG